MSGAHISASAEAGGEKRIEQVWVTWREVTHSLGLFRIGGDSISLQVMAGGAAEEDVWQTSGTA